MTNTNERRSPCDRRNDDAGPPHGWKDRRRRTERRIPEIREQAISEDDWERYFGNRAAAAPTTDTAAESEIASDVFDRARN